jgi:hypothetical protein
MILDLEAEKAVDSNKRLGIVSGYSQLRPQGFHFLVTRTFKDWL